MPKFISRIASRHFIPSGPESAPFAENLKNRPNKGQPMKLTYTVEYDVNLVDADSKFPGEALSQHVQEKLAEVARSAFVSAICKLDDTHHEFSPVAAMTRWGVTVTPSK